MFVHCLFLVVSCPPISTVDGYNISTQDLTYQTRVNITCAQGYFSTGVEYIITVCDATGQWVPDIDMCEGRYFFHFGLPSWRPMINQGQLLIISITWKQNYSNYCKHSSILKLTDNTRRRNFNIPILTLMGTISHYSKSNFSASSRNPGRSIRGSWFSRRWLSSWSYLYDASVVYLHLGPPYIRTSNTTGMGKICVVIQTDTCE